ncbi:hypothetical protein FQN54_000363 [Arachnomyces sp. PD_36]|nr:hypothetical protein FQN54_000363 [Arachnomyces sp. PD_36]
MAPPTNGSGKNNVNVLGDVVDIATFDQILEMDDDDDRDFSREIVYGFFEQADTTFDKMDQAIKDKSLQELSSLGHFLKGSSATLGLTKVKDACEKIQHFGAGTDESGTIRISDQTLLLGNIKQTLTDVRKDYDDVAKRLKAFYGEKL